MMKFILNKDHDADYKDGHIIEGFVLHKSSTNITTPYAVPAEVYVITFNRVKGQWVSIPITRLIPAP